MQYHIISDADAVADANADVRVINTIITIITIIMIDVIIITIIVIMTRQYNKSNNRRPTLVPVPAPPADVR